MSCKILGPCCQTSQMSWMQCLTWRRLDKDEVKMVFMMITVMNSEYDSLSDNILVPFGNDSCEILQYGRGGMRMGMKCLVIMVIKTISVIVLEILEMLEMIAKVIDTMNEY